MIRFHLTRITFLPRAHSVSILWQGPLRIIQKSRPISRLARENCTNCKVTQGPFWQAVVFPVFNRNLLSLALEVSEKIGLSVCEEESTAMVFHSDTE